MRKKLGLVDNVRSTRRLNRVPYVSLYSSTMGKELWSMTTLGSWLMIIY